MTSDENSDRKSGLSRRSVLRTAGLLAGAGALGGSVPDHVAADEGALDPTHANVRARTARHAWERGYRGRADRTLGLTDTGTDSRHPELGPWNGTTVTTEDGEFEIDDDPFRSLDGAIVPNSPKLLGWHNDSDRYGKYSKPRDSNGHGTHVASIMAGSGRASAVDPDRYAEDEPYATLLVGESLSYEVEARAGTGVFASVYGDSIEVIVEGPDGEELARANGASGTSEETWRNNLAETPTVHDDGEATYVVRVTAIEDELVTAGRVNRVAVGAFLPPEKTVGDRTADGADSIYAGIAPNAGIFTVTDLAAGTRTVGDHAADFAETFNARAVNMSWGWVGGLPLGATGELDDIPDKIRAMADEGILTVAAAGNSATPANSGSPAIAPEAISVVATGPLGGIAAYSSGGLAGIDEYDEPYMKPDVTAVGGKVNVLDIAALTGDPEAEVTETEPDDEFGEAELEPVKEAEEVESELAPLTELDDAVSGPADYAVELSEEVEDGLTVDDDFDSLLSNSPRQEGMGSDRVRDFTGKGGTSMASPSVCGMAGLVSQALEEDAPDAIAIPEPAEAGRDTTLRTKTTLLATATPTALNAAPYHRAHFPVYAFDDRDPYEGYGRANVGAAVDAATRDLTDRTVAEHAGLNLPEDELAVAGHVRVDEPGEVSAEVDFSHYSGGNAGAAKGDPHLDLFLYDAQNPDPSTGDPIVVAGDAGLEGDAEVSASVSVDDLEANGGERVFSVVAKLINVPGVVNGFDVRAHFDLATAFDPEGLVVEGERDADASVFTGGQTTHQELSAAVRHPGDEEVLLRDFVPEGWDVDEEYGDVEATTPAFGGGTYVYFGVDDPQSVYEDRSVFAEAPDDVEDSERYTFGPLAVTTDTRSTDEATLSEREYTELSGTEHSVTVVAEET